MMELYHTMILVLLGVMTLIVFVNVLAVRRVDATQKPGASPFVSVLIPARNEAHRIEQCLRSLVAQRYPNFEIIVLDDRSEDETWQVLQRWEQDHPRVRALRGSPVPDGWVGKCFACHQLSRYAHGQVLLFTDADTVHSPTSLSSAVAALQRTGADLLTVLPRLRLETFWERIIMPMLHFVTFTVLPFPLVHRSRDPRFAMANGQFMLFRRLAYEAIGGHEAVKSALVEDVWLARRTKQCGFRLRVMDGVDIVATRMYTSLAEIWSGFSKNIFAGFQFSLPAIMAVVLMLFATSVLPFGFLLGSVLFSASSVWQESAAVHVALILLMRIVLAQRFSLGIAPVLFHPLAMLMVIGIAMNSIRWALFANGLRWKGRVYRWDDSRKTIHLQEPNNYSPSC
jgi:chlorobactene glucosyltransferase